MTLEDVNVVVTDNYRNRFPEIVARFEEVGLKVAQQLQDIGVVRGSIDSSRLSDLEKMDGVAAVERSRRFNLAPPDSDIQ